MTQFLRAYQRADDNTIPSGVIRFVASSEGVKRDGMSLRAEDWDLDNYRKNPVVLWTHDYWGEHLPIGKAAVEIVDNKLMADVTFDLADPFAQQVERKYRDGYLNTVSVGWDAHEDRNELLDISAVPVPGDPDALIERQRRGFARIGERLLELTDEAPENSEVDWTGTALQMVRLFTVATDDEFDERAYKRLCRAYKRFGKEPPEVPERLALLGDRERRGLFLEDEPILLPELFTVRDEPPVPTDDDIIRRLHAIMTGDK